MRHSPRFVLCCVAVLLATTAARADPITFEYSVPSVSLSTAYSPTTSSLNFSTWGTWAASGATTLSLQYLASSFSPTPDAFVGMPITLSVVLTDDAAKGGAGSYKTGTLTFNGSFTGELPDNSSPLWNFGWTTTQQSITLGSPGQYHTYTVTAPVQNLTQDGYIGQHGLNVIFTIQPADYLAGTDPAPGMTSAAPEPATLALASLALPILVLARRRRRGKGSL